MLIPSGVCARNDQVTTSERYRPSQICGSLRLRFIRISICHCIRICICICASAASKVHRLRHHSVTTLAVECEIRLVLNFTLHFRCQLWESF